MDKALRLLYKSLVCSKDFRYAVTTNVSCPRALCRITLDIHFLREGLHTLILFLLRFQLVLIKSPFLWFIYKHEAPKPY